MGMPFVGVLVTIFKPIVVRVRRQSSSHSLVPLLTSAYSRQHHTRNRVSAFAVPLGRPECDR